MNDFLSKISGQIAGPIILGAFFPVVLFVMAVALVILPVTPYAQALTTVVQLLKIFEEKPSSAIVMTALVLVLSVVLYMLNTPLIRLYEGYPWKESWLGGKLRDRQRKRFDDATALRARIRFLRGELRREKLQPADGLVGAEQAVARLLNDEYPSDRGLVLPTRLGNVVRSFETYPLHRYGMPAIAVWPRLQGVIPATYAQGLDGAQTSFNFMLNCSFLSMVLALLLAFCGLRWANPFHAGSDHVWTGWCVVFAFLWWLFYCGAINRAGEWGTQVKAAFDLYRGLLLTQLGYDLKPETPDEERRIWAAINYKLAFPDDLAYPELPYKKLATTLLVQPPYVAIDCKRTVSMSGADALRVKVAIANNSPGAYDADDVILREELTSGQTYITDSCEVDGVSRRPMELSPLRIDIGGLEAGETRTVTYKVKIAAKV